MDLKLALTLSISLFLFYFSTNSYAACSDPAAINVNWSDCIFSNRDFSGADLRGANLAQTNFNNVNLNGADLRGVDAFNSVLTNVDLRNANLRGASFSSSQFSTVDFRGADMADSSFDSICLDNNSQFYDSELAFAKTIHQNDIEAGFAIRQIQSNSALFFISQLSCSGNSIPIIEKDPSRNTSLLALLKAYDQANSPDVGWPVITITTTDINNVTSPSIFYDEDLTTKYTSEAAISPYWQIDLKGWYDIEKIIIHTTADAYLSNAVLLVSDWPFGATPLYPAANDSLARYTIAPDQTSIEISIQRTAQYIRIQKLPSALQQLVFTEIEIIGRYASDTSNESPAPMSFTQTSCPDIAPNGLPGFILGDVNSSKNCVALLLTRSGNSRIDLNNCDFSNRSLRETDFTNTDIINANFSGANLQGANFANANATQANFRNSILTDTSFSDTNFERADFRNAVFGNTNFNGSSSGYACFTEIPQPFYDDGFSSPPLTRSTPTLNTSFGYARQSSTDLSRPATNAIDADVNSYSLTRVEDSPWWQLDMGAIYNITDIDLVSTVDYPGSISNSQLLISDWAFDSTPSASDFSVRSVSGAGISANAISFPTNQTARYVRVKLPDNAMRRLAVADINISSSIEPAAPSTRQPIPDGQKAGFPETQLLYDNSFILETDLESAEVNLNGLNSRLLTAHDKALRVKHLKDRLNQLNDRFANASRVLKLLKYIPQLKIPANSFASVISAAKAPVSTSLTAITPIENKVFSPARAQMKELSKRLVIGADQSGATAAYVVDGENLLEDAYFCARNTEDRKGRTPLEIFSAPMNPIIIAAIPVVEVVDDTTVLANTTIDELLSRLTIPELNQFDIELRKLEVEFYKVYNPLRDIGNIFNQNIEIDFVVEKLKFNVLDILSTDIPYADDFINEAMKLLDPVIKQLLSLLQIPNLPGLPDINFLTIQLDLFRYLDLNLLSYEFQFNFNLDFNDLDFLPLVEQPFPFCVTKPVIALYPKSSEDLDNDGLSNGDEILPYCDLGISPVCKDRNEGAPYYNTDAYSPDTDRDGFTDYFEVKFGMDPLDSTDAANFVDADRDGDGISDWEENLIGTDPLSKDTDGDNLDDYFEYTHSKISSDENKLFADPGLTTQFSGLSNSETSNKILNNYGNTILADPIVVTEYFDPTKPGEANKDFDNDGLSNEQEAQLGTNPYSPDSDEDGMPDAWEVQYNLDPADANDAAEDPDADRLINVEEYRRQLNPMDDDADSDGIPDGTELVAGLDPNNPADAAGDLDGDGISNLQEYLDGTLVDLSFSTAPADDSSSNDSNNSKNHKFLGAINLWWMTLMLTVALLRIKYRQQV